MNFIHVSTANDYVSFDWIGTNENNLIIGMIYWSEKQRQFFWQVDSKNSVVFSLPSFEIYRINF
jgi:hypothetical protein